MKFTHVLILTLTVLTCASLQTSRAASQQMQRAVCTGILDTGSGTAGSRIGDIEGKSCFLDADAAPERAVKTACKQGLQCEVVAMVTKFRNGNMQIQKVISAREVPVSTSDESTLDQNLVGSYKYVVRGYTGRMVISALSACQVKQELGCLGRSALKISLSTARLSGSNPTCELNAVENQAARIIGPVSHLAFADEDRHITDVEFRSRQGSVTAEVKNSEESGCGAGGSFSGTWVQDKARATQNEPMPMASVKPSQPDLASFAPKLSTFEGRWSDKNCNSRWNDWSINGLEVTFHDQSGGVDVERVIGVDSGGFRTQSVMASHGAVGGLWGYQPLASDTIRVRSISSGATFYLRRCPFSPTVVRDRENVANGAAISSSQPRTVAQDRTSVKIAPFTVIVNFSPQARQRMTELGEYLTIDASFYGEPTQLGEQYADGTGRVQLGDAAQTMPMKSYASATFSGNGIDLTKLRFIKEEEPFVLVNIYSARRAVSRNLLDCDIFQDPVMIAARGPVTLVCRIIGEN